MSEDRRPMTRGGARWRLCAEPGCGALVQGRGRCAVHRREAWARVHPGPARVRGRRLQRMRRELLEASPLCVRCLAAGLVTPATIRDHIVALAAGGTEDAAMAARAGPPARLCSV